MVNKQIEKELFRGNPFVINRPFVMTDRLRQKSRFVVFMLQDGVVLALVTSEDELVITSEATFNSHSHAKNIMRIMRIAFVKKVKNIRLKLKRTFLIKTACYSHFSVSNTVINMGPVFGMYKYKAMQTFNERFSRFSHGYSASSSLFSGINREEYNRNLLQENNLNPRKFWNIRKKLFPTKSKANFASTTCNKAENIAKANTFCDYFSTIVKTLKSSVSLLNYYVWKTPHYIAQRTVKIFRMEYSGNINKPDSCRPISVLPALSKVLEKAVHIQLSGYLEANQLLSEFQFGYRSNRSTSTAGALFVGNIKKEVDNGKLTGAVFIDLTKAFDTISHAVLLVIKYADDTVVYFSHSKKSVFMSTLTKELSNISSYLDLNELIINLKKGKTEVVLIGTAKRLSLNTDDFTVNYRDPQINHASNKSEALFHNLSQLPRVFQSPVTGSL
ncbi:uncharacterized protein LOC130646126 [Hydractinia symbiolongicarpus]|uniref:uncharacterized protein LOC130646126 n=1 Tax=Hydractinia symbiolongicarpus TaxID=13093 RepID=UPI00254BFA22|nr:uncharacterized protein LOC130646126 [Hydractinia symbiolongicarpus]